MSHETGDFPFEEIRSLTGDYWPSIEAAMAAGFDLSQIWSVCESDGVFCYGPPHHRVNLLGYIATTEWHDHDTYYEEGIEEDD